MQNLKELVRKTPLRRIYHALRSLKTVSEFPWTTQDQIMFEFYAQFRGPNRIWYDVGANMGNRTNIFLRLGDKVIAVEPQTSCVHILTDRFKGNPNLVIVPSALGEATYETEINVATTNVLSSMNPEWIQAMKQSGRFGEHEWTQSYKVKVVTLDSLIAIYGKPDFIKIDVEGFEEQVIRGLSKPVAALSFEFTPEVIDLALRNIRYLNQIGRYEVNYSLGESMAFGETSWLSPNDAEKALLQYKDNLSVFGDVYCRLVN